MNPRALTRRSLLVLGALALAAPAIAPPAFAPPAYGQGAVSVPFQIIKGKIFIDVIVGGRPVQAMVDSGASYSGIDTALAQTLGIVARGRKVSLRHVQGASSGRWADGVALGLGGQAATRPMLVTDFSLLTASVLHPIVVLLGSDFLGAHVAQFDFDTGQLTLHGRGGFTAPAGAVLVPLTRPKGLRGEAAPMTAAVVVEGQTVQALVDTGSQSPLIVSPPVARRLGLLKDRIVSSSPIGGIGGTSTGKIASLKTLALGRQAFVDVPVQVTARPLSRVDANLGLEVLSRFNLWLDLAGGRMWLAARTEQAPFRRNLLGFFGIPDGDSAIRVTFVAAGSPAEAAGVEDGDVIIRINDQPAGVAQVTLANAPAGTRLTLTLERGETKSLVLAPYY